MVLIWRFSYWDQSASQCIINPVIGFRISWILHSECTFSTPWAAHTKCRRKKMAESYHSEQGKTKCKSINNTHHTFHTGKISSDSQSVHLQYTFPPTILIAGLFLMSASLPNWEPHLGQIPGDLVKFSFVRSRKHLTNPPEKKSKH